MVYTDKDGMVCHNCGGRCEAGTDNYDDVMHLEGCARRVSLDIWAKASTDLRSKAHNSMLCVRYRKSIMDLTNAPFARSCPAWSMLFSAVPREMLLQDSSIMCGECASCYEEYYEPYEEEVLEIAEEWPKRQTLRVGAEFLK